MPQRSRRSRATRGGRGSSPANGLPGLRVLFLVLFALAFLPGFSATICRGGSVPHPAVARIVVPERSATSYGTGTLIDVRDQYGLVITNWHVVRDGSAPPEVIFSNGFRSQARPLKLDSNWDLAALVIWRPPIDPVKISHAPPRPGEPLTICGYGQGEYRAVTGRCTQYFAPRVDYPQELVELNVEARQGDSGGPIFNQRGELSGVLFGAGRGTTMGSYGGRVHSFLASLAPDIGQAETQRVAQLLPPQPVARANADDSGSHRSDRRATRESASVPPSSAHSPGVVSLAAGRGANTTTQMADPFAGSQTRQWPASGPSQPPAATEAVPQTPPSPLVSVASSRPEAEPLSWTDIAGRGWISQLGTLLAIVGAIVLILQMAKLASST